MATAGSRLGWGLLAAGMAFNAAGDTFYQLISYFRGEIPSVSVADVCSLSSYPLLFAGVIALLRRRGATGLRDALADAVTVAIAAGIVIWQLLIVNPGIAAEGTSVERAVFLS